MIRRLLFVIAATAACWVSASAHADTWPARPLRLVVPFPPGGAADLFGRMIAGELSQALKQTVIVENRAGAGGNIGTREVATAPGDGYTLLQGTVGTHAINPTLYGRLPYDTRKDFVPVAFLATIPNVLVVHPAVPAKSVAELTALAKSRPGRLNAASSGNGSSIHLSAELYKHLAKVYIVHVPYRGGATALTELIGGQVDLMFDNLPTSLPHIAKGTLRPLAVTSASRSPLLPDVPTMVEAGVAGYEATAWSGLFVPAGTPPAVVERLNSEVNKAMQSDKVQARLRELGAETRPMKQREFAAFVQKEHDKWSEVVKFSGAKAE
ncbi:tripartite tricarboxylate transporter substrate binding protein [Aquabacterium sp. A7-Y]|uniref:Bug family tripartite tricarboxylate transporter substrate binding protein n=1 Tax=Aquabacterium sp. A7-Y TaxID=1349605 RepID=UPI00223D414C|nr:tripartite tricarboxylate transporter substrate binding protein [Aquabacterium sp. A7-Y]MCW7539970.1 tripartite tricarboxylate transporter substrate binding protein [Aquabacterium sp. A7-Y]